MKSRCLPHAIIVCTAALVLALPLVNGMLVYPAFRDILMDNLKKDASLIARHTALELFPADSDAEYPTLGLAELMTIEGLERDFNLLKLRFINEGGVVLYSTDSEEFGRSGTGVDLKDIRRSGAVHSALTTMALPGKAAMDVVVSTAPVIHEGRFQGALEIYHDVTDRKGRMDMIVLISSVGMTVLSLGLVVAFVILLRKGTAYVRLLQQTQRLRSDVERIVQHDLRSPLTNLLSGTNYLQSVITKPDQVAILEQMQTSGWRMMHMINRSLDLYKMECGIYSFQPESLDILAVAREVAAELSDLALTRQVTVRLTRNGEEAAEHEKYIIPAERMLCHTLLANLVQNALEAAPTKGTVTIDVCRDGSDHVLTVSNPGKVPEQIRDTFFDKYVTRGKRAGTGLGTYSARLIAETQQGSISLDYDGNTVRVIVRFPKEPVFSVAGA